MTCDRPLHRRCERWRIENGGGNSALILQRQTDDLCVFDGAIGPSWAAVTTKSLTLRPCSSGRALNDGEHIGGNSRLDARGAGSFGWHHRASLSTHFVRAFTVHFKEGVFLCSCHKISCFCDCGDAGPSVDGAGLGGRPGPKRGAADSASAIAAVQRREERRCLRASGSP